MTNEKRITRRELFRKLIPFAAGVAVTTEVVRNLAWPTHFAEAAQESGLPWGNGKYQTFPGLKTVGGETVVQFPDLGWLGPDVDTIFGFDFQGNIPTGAKVIHRPKGEVLETRVIGVKRAGLETVQFNEVLRGDRFDVWQISEYGGDETLGEMIRLHAENTAREHQKVVRIDDLGLFQKQWGKGETTLLNRIIRAQRPSLEELGIQEPNFVNPRTGSLRRQGMK